MSCQLGIVVVVSDTGVKAPSIVVGIVVVTVAVERGAFVVVNVVENVFVVAVMVVCTVLREKLPFAKS